MIYVEAVSNKRNQIEVNLETLIVIYVYRICDTNHIKLNVVYKDKIEQPSFKIDLSQVSYAVVELPRVPLPLSFCIWPVISADDVVVAGLCSVARQIVKSSKNNKVKTLLGFKEACLLACSENSIWTKFCEIETPKAVIDFLTNVNLGGRNKIHLPPELTKFEYHMQQPVRAHNVYKLAREKHDDKSIKSSVPLQQLNLPHIYGEGSFMTLADVVLFPCFEIFHRVLGNDFESLLPLSSAWFENMRRSDLPILEFDVAVSDSIDKFEIVQQQVPKQSLYKSDRNRYKPQNRIYTKQNDVENSIDLIAKSNIEIRNDFEPFGSDVDFDWSDVPFDVNPLGGALPKKRANRKCEQLSNLAKAVMRLSRNHRDFRIVDFCSGSGHLGLVLATLLPDCQIVLVENKERSLAKARERTSTLRLTNVVLLQCNLDYFNGKFDVGVSLHACGVATDLVIQNCIVNKAHFVCCPCCYGGIHDCYHLKYPRSTEFADSNLTYRDYLSIAHAADQTHDSDNAKTKQGFVCMDIVDTDRKLQAQSCGYVVYLGKLQPTSCTPKNNLLVGVYNG